MPHSPAKVILIVLAGGLSAWGGTWNARQAASYLDSREKDWAAWPAAQAAGGTCVSCHTQMTYLMARPALRKLLGENQPTAYETALLDGLKERTDKNERMFGSPKLAKEPLASQAEGVQSVLTALLLARSEHSQSMSATAERAFQRMWAAQIRTGAAKGSWAWFQLDLDPWETNDSAYYGATLAALAVGAAPASYRERPDVKARVSDLAEYIGTASEGQPLHNRLMLLWASPAVPDVFPKPACGKLVSEVLGKQQPDGGWTMESLGPWKEHPDAAISSGSSNYSTAVVALALEQAGLKPSNPALSKALHWLRRHQDPAGYWEAISMNKHYAAGSMPDLFMRDAATAFASLALANAEAR